MVKPVFNTQARLQYQLKQLGWQGILGLILIGLSVLLLLFAVMPDTKKIDALSVSYAELKANVVKGKVQAKPDHHLDVTTTLNALTPKQSEANSQIALMLNIATHAGLTTDKVDYASQSYSSSLLKYQIKFPTQGSYIQIRQFINEVLNALPTIALADIRLKRDDIGNDVIDANIQFNLYVRKNGDVHQASISK